MPVCSPGVVDRYPIGSPLTLSDRGEPSPSILQDAHRVFALIEDERHLIAQDLYQDVRRRLVAWEEEQGAASAPAEAAVNDGDGDEAHATSLSPSAAPASPFARLFKTQSSTPGNNVRGEKENTTASSSRTDDMANNTTSVSSPPPLPPSSRQRRQQRKLRILSLRQQNQTAGSDGEGDATNNEMIETQKYLRSKRPAIDELEVSLFCRCWLSLVSCPT